MCFDRHGHLPLVEAILEHEDGRVGLECLGENGRSSLAWASQGGHVEIVREILAAKGDVDGMNDFGWTPLFSAVQIGHAEVSTVSSPALD